MVVGLGADGKPNTADDIVISGTSAAPVSLASCRAHRLTPSLPTSPMTRCPTASPTATSRSGSLNPGNGLPVYDNELLDAHFIAGDGRANENIGLTAVHHIFHSEHNRLGRAHQGSGARHQGPRLYQRVARRRMTQPRSMPSRQTPAALAALADADLGRRPPFPGRQVRHRNAISASGLRGFRPQNSAQHRLLRSAGRLPRGHQSEHRRGVRPRRLPVRPFHADRGRSPGSTNFNDDQIGLIRPSSIRLPSTPATQSPTASRPATSSAA